MGSEPKLPFPIERGDVPPLRYILTLLIAAVKAQGGSLRLDVADVSEVKDGEMLIKDYDRAENALVLRIANCAPEVYILEQQRSQETWQRQPAGQQPPQPKKVWDDAALAEAETKRQQQEALRQFDHYLSPKSGRDTIRQ